MADQHSRRVSRAKGKSVVTHHAVEFAVNLRVDDSVSERDNDGSLYRRTSAPEPCSRKERCQRGRSFSREFLVGHVRFLLI